MQAFLSFIKSKQFFLNFGLILVVIFLLFFGVIRWLSSYTEHGEFVTVPDFKGQAIGNLEKFVSDKNVGYQIIDSIYDPKEKSGIVLRQDPEPNIKVKHNRTVYLYVTGMLAPQIKMPKLIDKSERQARLIVTTYGLKVGKMIEKKADCNGCVMAQLINGKEIEPGKEIKKGSVVDLVIGRKDNFYNIYSDSSKVEEPDFNKE
ncbi:MAG TPA: PASTA domain-containing protein [Bacteroidia bacterium]|nr:PASTA domain-containing protein [Bacteroidia bacterium]